jgi:PRTRC genetic system ThiF family protein
MYDITGGDKKISITIADDDIVTDANVGRANFYPVDVGQYKAEVIADRLELGLGIRVEAKISRIKPSSDLSRYDIVITCVDSGQYRYELGKHHSSLNIDTIWVDVGNGINDGQVCVGSLGKPSTNKYPNIYDLYQDLLLLGDDDDLPSCSLKEALTRQDMGVNLHAASRAFNATWALVRHGRLAYSLDFFDFKSMIDKKVEATECAWRTFGYKAA